MDAYWSPKRELSRLLLGIMLIPVAGALASPVVHVEVFTSADLAVSEFRPATDDARLPSVALDVYEIDGIAQLEAELSRGLPREVEAAKGIAIKRFAGLNDADMPRARRAALGLAKAVQYGIDRYPAIVFDGQAVVYGVTDLDEALRWYEEWRETPVP